MKMAHQTACVSKCERSSPGLYQKAHFEHWESRASVQCSIDATGAHRPSTKTKPVAEHTVHRVGEQTVNASKRVWNAWHVVFEEGPAHTRGTSHHSVDVAGTPPVSALEDALVLVCQGEVGANRWHVELPAHVSQTSRHGR